MKPTIVCEDCGKELHDEERLSAFRGVGACTPCLTARLARIDAEAVKPSTAELIREEIRQMG